MPKITLPFEASKLAQQNLISTSRVGLVFTYTLGLAGGNNPGASAPAGGLGGAIAGAVRNQLSPGGAVAGAVAGALARQGTPVALGGGLVAQELVVGAGWKDVRIEQNINVTQENALGWYDIVETIEHNVASNTMTAAKMALRWAMLSKIGLAPYGVDTLLSPLLNCYVFDPKEKQRGNDVGYVRLERLHIQTNALNITSGQTVMENVTFRPNNIRRVDNQLPAGLMTKLKAMFPGMYEDMESIGSGNFTYEQ